MSHLPKKRLLAYAALLVNVIVWGAALAVVKRGFQDGLTPIPFLLGRFTIAGLLAIPLLLALKKSSGVKQTFRPKNLITVTALELLGSVLALGLLYLGLEKTSSVEANLIGSIWPVILTFGGILFLREKEQKNEYAGLALAVVGTFVLVGRPILDGQANGHLTGNLLILAYSVVNAVYLLLAKKYYHSLNKWAVTAISFWVSAISLFAVSTYFHFSPLQFLTFDLWHLSFWPLMAIIYMATLGSIIGLSLYLFGQGLIEASEASLFSYLYPVIGVPASVLLLRESVSLIDIVALLVILVGVYLAEKR